MSMSSNRIMVAARPALVVPVQAGPLVSDSFDRADNATSLGTADTGQVWTTFVGTMGISANRAYSSALPGVAYVDAGASDVDITCDITHDGDSGVNFRSVDAENYMMARLGVNKVELYRRQSGWYLISEVAMTLTVGQTYAFRVVASGSTIDVYVDGVKKITATDSFQSTVTKHGLYGVPDTFWDNFKVEAAAPLVTDSFDRADSATSLGTAETGQVWSVLAGTWGIETNRAYSPGTTPDDRQAVVESGAANVKVAVDLVALATSGGPGLLFRGVDASNYWIFIAEPGAGRWVLYKRVAGAHTVVGSLAETPFAGRLEVTCSGATITCKVDGVTKITATDTQFETATQHGIREWGGPRTTRWDNFRVEAA